MTTTSACPPLAVIPTTASTGRKRRLAGKSHWLKPLAILCCLVNAAVAATYGKFTYFDDGTSIKITKYPRAEIGAVVIPASIIGKPVTSIGGYAFEGCTGLTSVTIPNSVTTIGEGAFGGCTGLITMTVPNGVTSIDIYAFSGCTGPITVTLPSTVTSIGRGVFEGCTALTSISVDIANPNYSSADGVLFDKTKTSLIQCPGGKSGTYVVPNSVNAIYSAAFSGCIGLASLAFLGDAPLSRTGVFDNTAAGFTVYYAVGSNGFTTPNWRGYPAYPRQAPQFTSAPPAASELVAWHYVHTCTATGLPTPTFAVTAGALPDGLTLSSSGEVSGTPTSPGTFTGTITASNGFPPDATQAFSIQMRDPWISTAGGTHGSVSGGGPHGFNTTATLHATAQPGYVFAEWSGDAAGMANPLSVLVDGDKTVTALFAPDTRDDDGDGLTNYQEIVEYGTDPTKQDTDGDGVNDKKDGRPLDPAETLDTDRDGIGDNADLDDDGDGYSDEDEINIHHTNPKRADSDGDGLTDPAEIETHHTNPNLADTDNDGLRDGEEFTTHHTNPLIGDIDGDGFLDGYEVLTGKLPLDPLDKPALVAEARTAIEFTFPAAVGKYYRIEASTDLATWEIVESGIAGTGGQVQRFYSTRGQPKRYFRVEEIEIAP